MICNLNSTKHSAFHALIYLADKIKEQLGIGNFDCETFVDFQGKIDIVDHEIVILKLNYYGVRGTANNHLLKIELDF